MAPWYSGFATMAEWVGVTPPVTSRKGGRGSSSNEVRLIVVTTALVLGSTTDKVFESSLQRITRSRVFAELVWANERPSGNEVANAAAPTPVINSRRVTSMSVLLSFMRGRPQ